MATKFGIRNYSRNGNQVTFTVVALNQDGSIDTNFTGGFTWGLNGMSDPGVANFTAADLGQRVYTTTILDPNVRAGLAANFPGAQTGGNLSVSGPNGTNVSFGNQGDHLLVGGIGNDIITSNVGDDLLLLQQGGNDTANGGGGNDGIYFGPAYTSADTVNGGAGNRDQVGLQGDYGAGVTLGSLLGVELVVLLPGDDARFGGQTGTNLSYNIAADAGTVVSDNKLTIQANLLRAGENLTFNGSATAIDFIVYGGLGTDILTGGSGNDGFLFGQGRFGASDTVNGGAGTLDQLGLQGDFTGADAITFGADQLSGLELIVLLSAADNRFGSVGGVTSYEITMNDGNVGAGEPMIVSANTLGADETLAFDGSAEMDGRFEIYSGGGNDVIVGGAGDDLIFGAGRGDTLTGGGGNDIFAYRLVTDSDANERDGIQDFTLGDLIDLSRIDANINLDGNQDFSFAGTNAFSGTAGELRYENISLGGPIFLVQGDVNGDGVSDLEIVLVITDGHTLTTADFIGVSAPATLSSLPTPASSNSMVERSSMLVADETGSDKIDLSGIARMDHGALKPGNVFDEGPAVMMSAVFHGGDAIDLVSLPENVYFETSGFHAISPIYDLVL